jgi:hypothetical protein
MDWTDEKRCKYKIRRLSALSYAEQRDMSLCNRRVLLAENEQMKLRFIEEKCQLVREHKRLRAIRLALAGGDNSDGKYYQRILIYLLEYQNVIKTDKINKRNILLH